MNHPSEWSFGGYNDIQVPKKKNVLIDYGRLRQLLGFEIYEDVRVNHRKWVESYLQNQTKGRDEKWTRSLAVGSKVFIDGVKKKVGLAATGRKRIGSGASYQLRESQSSYGDHLGTQNSNIEAENTYFWD